MGYTGDAVAGYVMGMTGAYPFNHHPLIKRVQVVHITHHFRQFTLLHVFHAECPTLQISHRNSQLIFPQHVLPIVDALVIATTSFHADVILAFPDRLCLIFILKYIVFRYLTVIFNINNVLKIK
jgi:hypothetical protein